MWTNRCSKCNKPTVCSSNLWKLRGTVIGCTCGAAVLGTYLLPTLGFGDGGVTVGTIASGWQSGIGNVAAGSIFAGLTSLGMVSSKTKTTVFAFYLIIPIILYILLFLPGMTTTGTILFGGTSAALTLLGSTAVATKLDWCQCANESKSPAK